MNKQILEERWIDFASQTILSTKWGFVLKSSEQLLIVLKL